MPRRALALAALLILLSGAAVAIAAISENTGVAYGGTSTLTGPDGVCKTVTNNSPTGKQVYVPGNTTAEWQSFVASPPSGVSLGSCCGGSYTISSNQVNLNLYTYAGSPSCTGGSYTFTINPGVYVGSNSTALPALSTGSWPSGTTLTLVNNGYVMGMGGNGGNGNNSNVYNSGLPGGPAISLSYPLSINNGGSIYGGGGGGGVGYSWRTTSTGCAGGGGQGYGNSLGGTGVICASAATGGNISAPGAGGVSLGTYGASGGNGGAWGTDGATGGKCAGGTCSGTPRRYGLGGAAGASVVTNGYGLTWISVGGTAGLVQ